MKRLGKGADSCSIMARAHEVASLLVGPTT